MRVFLAGSTGAVGGPLLRQLVARGHKVTATTTRPANAGRLRSLGADPVVMNGLDAASVGEAVARAAPDAIIHQMTALSGIANLRHFDRTFATTNRLRIEGTRHLLAAASAAGVRRFVAQGYTGWPNGRDGGPIHTEVDPLATDVPANQRESLAAIRFVEEAVPAAPLDGIVLRYGNFYGPGATESLVDLVRRRRLPLIGNGAGVWSWIHVDDAASAAVAAVERGGRGLFNVVDDEPAPVSEWLPYLAQVAGARAPLRLAEWVGRILAGDVVVSMMTTIRGSSNAKAKRELGWRPAWTTWRDGFRHGLTPAGGAAAA